MKKKVIRKKAGKCKHIVHNDLCDLTKNWAREFDNKGEPLDNYEYLYCEPKNCPLIKKKPCPKEKCRHWNFNDDATSLKCHWWISCIRTSLKNTRASVDYYDKRK